MAGSDVIRWKVRYEVIEKYNGKIRECDTFIVAVSIYDGLDTQFTKLVEELGIHDCFPTELFELKTYCVGKDI